MGERKRQLREQLLRVLLLRERARSAKAPRHPVTCTLARLRLLLGMDAPPLSRLRRAMPPPLLCCYC